MKKFLEFEQSEYKRRLACIQDKMGRDGLSALLLTWRENFRYVTGIYSEIWINLSRPFACWVRSSGDPIVVVADIELAASRANSWLSDLRSYPSNWIAKGPL